MFPSFRSLSLILAVAVAIEFAFSANSAQSAPITTNLVLELRADAGVTADGSNFVSSWADQSGQANDVTQAGGGNQPLLVTGVTNGTQTFNVLRFDGTDDVLSRIAGAGPPVVTMNNLATNTSGGTVFMVYRTSQASVNQVALSYGVNDSNRLSFGMANTTNWNTRFRIAGASAAGSTATVSSAEGGGGGAPLLDTFYVQAAVWDGTTAGGLTSKLLLPDGSVITGVDTGTVGAAAFAPTALHVGRYVFAAGAGLNFQGDMAEVLIFNDDLTASDQATMFNYLGQKYGVTAVPEPSTCLLAALGLAGLGWVSSKRRK